MQQEPSEVIDISNDEGILKLISFLNNPELLINNNFRLKDLGINSSRILNHWENQGLLISKRKDKSKWRRFSFIEVVWLNIIQELRLFGIPIKIIKKLKETLLKDNSLLDSMESMRESLDYLESKRPKAIVDYFEHLDIPEEQASETIKLIKSKKYIYNTITTNFLTHTILDFIYFRMPISLWVFQDGSFTVWKDISLEFFKNEEELLRKLRDKTSICISISKIIKKFITNADPETIIPQLNLLNRNESYILSVINSEEYDSIKINFKDRKLSFLELNKAEDTKKKIVDILAENKYQDIIIKQHDGRVTKIENTVKVKL